MRATHYEATEIEGVGPGAAWWRYKFGTLPVSLLIGGGVAALALLAPQDLEAESHVYLRDPRGSTVLGTAGSGATEIARYAAQRAEFLQSEQVLGEAAVALGDVSVDDLEDHVVAESTTSSDLMVTCTASEGDQASRICAAVVEAYRAASKAQLEADADAAEQVLLDQREELLGDPDIDPQANALDEIDLRIADLAVNATLFGDGVEFVTGPEVYEPWRIRPVIQYGAAGLIFGVLATGGVAWALANRRPIVTSGRAAGAVLGAPVLGEIESRRVLKALRKGRPSGEFQLLATGLAALGGSGVVSTASLHRVDAVPRVVAELARATARDGRSVLVIDGDGTDRDVGSVLGVPERRPGLTDVLDGVVTVQRAVVTQPTGAGRVDVLGAGSRMDDPAALMRSKAARDLISGARERYNLVFVHAAPVLDDPVGAALASQSDGVILFVPAKTATAELQMVRDRLDVVRAPLLGVVYDRSGG